MVQNRQIGDPGQPFGDDPLNRETGEENRDQQLEPTGQFLGIDEKTEETEGDSGGEREDTLVEVVPSNSQFSHKKLKNRRRWREDALVEVVPSNS